MARPYKTRARRPIADRFWEKVDKNGPAHPELGPCWVWTASVQTNGYGQIGNGGRHGGYQLAHRLAFELANGPIPDGLHVDHICHNDSGCPGGKTCPHRICVNPAHLRAVTPKANLLAGESLSARQARQTHCIHGHEFTPENTRMSKGHRKCRTCDRRHEERRTANRRQRRAAS